MKKVLITDATDEQLKAFARDVQQIDQIPATRGPLIAALIQSGHDQEWIMVDGASNEVEAQSDSPELQQYAEPAETVAKMPQAGFGYWRDSPMVRLKILPTDRPGGNEPAHPIINGSAPLVIQRNKLVEIPYDFYMVLKQAGGTKIVPGEKPTDPLVAIDYYEYPMVDVVLPSPEAIAKWQARTSGDELGRAKARAA